STSPPSACTRHTDAPSTTSKGLAAKGLGRFLHEPATLFDAAAGNDRDRGQHGRETRKRGERRRERGLASVDCEQRRTDPRDRAHGRIDLAGFLDLIMEDLRMC